MSSASPLPIGWSKILDEIQMRLDDAIASTDARVAQAPHMEENVNPLPARHQEIADWTSRFHRLNAFLESAEQIVQSVDEILCKEETELRQHLSTGAALRQKLEEQTARAIG